MLCMRERMVELAEVGQGAGAECVEQRPVVFTTPLRSREGGLVLGEALGEPARYAATSMRKSWA